MCVVGEWLGDTADESFAAALLSDWLLIKRVTLPDWTDTAHELTIWQRAPLILHQPLDPLFRYPISIP